MTCKHLILLCCTAALVFAVDSPAEKILLERVRVHMSQNLTRLPNYTCTQTIERLVRQAPSKRSRLMDTVRLEVALVDGKELYAWPGSKKFEDQDLRDMIAGGTVGTGQFALYAKAVFQTNAPVFSYGGQGEISGAQAHRWDFVVPQNRSGYLLRVGANEAVVGYHGSFWANTQTFDLIRLEVTTDDIPARLQLESAGASMEYRRIRIGGGEFLLPVTSELQMEDVGGTTSRNRTTFASCRQYTGESVIRYEDEAEAETAADSTIQVDAPAGLTLELSLETPIRSDASAIGDPVTAVLRKPLKIGGGVIAPKGSWVHGRLTFLRLGSVQPPVYVVGLHFWEIEFGKTRARVNPAFDYATFPTAMMSSASRASVWHRVNALPDLKQLNLPGSVFFVPASNLILDRGFQMRWRTLPLQAEDKDKP